MKYDIITLYWASGNVAGRWVCLEDHEHCDCNKYVLYNRLNGEPPVCPLPKSPWCYEASGYYAYFSKMMEAIGESRTSMAA